MSEKLKISSGEDDFRTLRELNDVYYVDKSLFIKDVIDNRDKVVLITRPRRFGKTMNMTMLNSFFNRPVRKGFTIYLHDLNYRFHTLSLVLHHIYSYDYDIFLS